MPTIIYTSELEQPPVVRSGASRPQHFNSLDFADRFSQQEGEITTPNEDSLSTEPEIASHLALVITSDKELNFLIISGVRENPERFREHLITCIRLFATEVQHHSILECERRAAVFIAEHVFTITWQIQSELGILDQLGEMAFEDEKAYCSSPGFFSEALEVDPSVGEDREDDFLIRSNFAAVQRFILSSPSLQRLIIRLEYCVDKLCDENEARILATQQEKAGVRKVFWSIFSHMTRILEPKPHAGTIRIRWSCSCGAMMWDDVSQRSDVDAKILEKRLNRLFRTVPNGHTTAQDSNTTFNPLGLLQVLGNSFCAQVRLITRKHARQRDPENTVPPSSHQIEADADIYLLTCVDAGQGLPKLFQKKWSSIENDKAYFQLLRAFKHTGRTGLMKWLDFQTVTAIEYVRVWDLRLIAWLMLLADFLQVPSGHNQLSICLP